MGTTTGSVETDLIADLVDGVRRDRWSLPEALAELARAIDERRCTVSPRTPLVLPRLVALADETPRRGSAGWPEGMRAAALGPEVLGQVHEALLDGGHRRRGGVFYTPADVAAGLTEELMGRVGPQVDPGAEAIVGRDAAAGHEPLMVCDPATGGGVFLLAAASALERLGTTPRTVVERCLWGVDVDPLAVAVTEAALILWARSHGTDVDRLNVVCADTLLDGIDAWPDPPPRGFDVVLGNPPFQNQLGSDTARSSDRAARLRDRWGPAVFRYADSAALFLLAATSLAAPGGRVGLIVPVPVLVTDDAERVRRLVLDRTVVEHLWIADDDVFDIGVRVCAPILRRRTDGDEAGAGEGLERSTGPIPVERSRGREFRPLATATVDLGGSSTWGGLVADVFGVPVLAAATGSGRLGDFCSATAGFRDQYYGLRPFVTEAVRTERDACDGDDHAAADAAIVGSGPRWAKLVTSGLIDPAHLRWGSHPTRFDRRSWDAPLVDLDRLRAEDADLARWSMARLVPKVVIATQTRVLEAVVDVDGDCFPSVPTIALVADAERLWHAAAVVLAPPTTAWAMSRHIGAALTADALKVSARQVLDAPLPVDDRAWERGAARLRAASAAAAADDATSWRSELERFGFEMTAAYAAPDEVRSWWQDRLPRWR